MKNLWEIHSKKCPHYLVQLDGDCRVGEKVQLGWAVQKVKVQLEGKNHLHFAEVQVFDYADNNVALNRPATQSTEQSPSESAAKAVDGNVNTASHTNREQGKHTYDGTTLYMLFNWNMYPDFAVSVSNPRCILDGWPRPEYSREEGNNRPESPTS